MAAPQASVRRTPSNVAPVIAVLGRNSGLKIDARAGAWRHVRSGSLAGWMRSTLLTTSPPAGVKVMSRALPNVGASEKRPPDSSGTPAASDRTRRETGTPADHVPSIPNRVSERALTADSWEYRDPGTARDYAFVVPGGGNVYSGEYVKGAALAGAALVAVFRGVDKITDPNCGGGFLLALYVQCAKLETSIILASYVYGIFDAPRSAERMNTKRAALQSIRSSASLAPSIGAGQSASIVVGARITVRF